MRSHGESSSGAYTSWQALKQRCLNPRATAFESYGGRGISVCEQWSGPNGFAQFLKDMGPRPPRHSIDRIDPNGNYEPRNCRWANARVQAQNTRLPLGETRARNRERRIRHYAAKCWYRFGRVQGFLGEDRLCFAIAEELQETFGPPRGLPLRLVDFQIDASDDSDDPFRRMDVTAWEAA